jgi:hypothetical protein
MSNYKLSKIYKITSKNTDEVYIGATSQKYISKRFTGHKYQYKKYLNNENKTYLSSFEILKNGDCKIELLESYPCNCIEELRKREGYWQRKIKCVNIRTEGRTKEEYLEIRKKYKLKYNKENAEKIKEMKKKNYPKYKENKLLYEKEYVKKNKDKVKLYKKNLYQYQKSWGVWNDNNLLDINLDIFK